MGSEGASRFSCESTRACVGLAMEAHYSLSSRDCKMTKSGTDAPVQKNQLIVIGGTVLFLIGILLALLAIDRAVFAPENFDREAMCLRFCLM